MDKLYHETNNALQNVQIALGRLESSNNEQEAQSIVQMIYADVSKIQEMIKRLDEYTYREPAQKRQMAIMRVDQLRHDTERVNMAVLAVHTKMTQKWRAATERAELLTQRHRPNDTALSIGDHELQMNDRLQSSHNHLDELINQGSAVLENIRSQHLNLRGVRRRMLGIGAALGLSNSTLQVIDRRVREDKLIFFIGVIVCCIFMYAFYRFWKG